MKNKIYASIGLCVAFFFLSCGPSEKLKQAWGQTEEANSRNRALTKNVEDLNAQVASLNAQVAGLSSQNKQAATEFAQYKQQCENLQVKYNDAISFLNNLSSVLQQMEDKLGTAMGDLQGRGMSVSHKRGLLYVSMADELLYKSGSSKLNQKGIDALQKIAGAMNDYPNVKVVVVGHTDDVMSKKGSDNWSLSTERANSVVRTLKNTYKIDASRLTAAGKGQFEPLADNSSVAGKAKNRRTDIIFNPDMDKFWDDLERKH